MLLIFEYNFINQEGSRQSNNYNSVYIKERFSGVLIVRIIIHLKPYSIKSRVLSFKSRSYKTVTLYKYKKMYPVFILKVYPKNASTNNLDFLLYPNDLNFIGV